MAAVAAFRRGPSALDVALLHRPRTILRQRYRDLAAQAPEAIVVDPADEQRHADTAHGARPGSRRQFADDAAVAAGQPRVGALSQRVQQQIRERQREPPQQRGSQRDHPRRRLLHGRGRAAAIPAVVRRGYREKFR